MIATLIELTLRVVGVGVVATSIYVVAVALTRYGGAEHEVDTHSTSYKRISERIKSQKSNQTQIRGK